MSNKEKYFHQLAEFRNQMSETNRNYLTTYELEDDISSAGEKFDTVFEEDSLFMDTIYLMQNQYCIRLFNHIVENPDNKKAFKETSDIKCLDVGSQLSFVTYLSTHTPFYYLEPRLPQSGPRLEMKDLNLTFLKGEAQNIPLPDSSLKLITSLHAVEHFGLGRYGDCIDYYGDINGLKEYARVLQKGGFLICSVPVTSPANEKIIFNKNRLYSCDTFTSMLESAGFDCKEARIILPPLNELRSEHGYHLIAGYTPNNIELIDKITEKFSKQQKSAPDFALIIVAQYNPSEYSVS